jgi:hypothetical protein
MLVPPEGGGEYILQCGATKYSVGVVLTYMQHDGEPRVIVF